MPNVIVSNNLIEFQKVSKFYNETVVALRDISCSIGRGEFVCIVGVSGSGKSTLLKLIAGLEMPTTGNIKRPDKISMVFQNGALFPWLSAEENVAVGIQTRNLSKSDRLREGHKYIKMVGLEDYSARYPRELSGGQRQRVGVARAFAAEPSVLLLDEPFAALDVKTTSDLCADLLKIWQETKTTIVMVSHSIEEAVFLADRVMLVADQAIKQIFNISLPRPRRDDTPEYIATVHKIRQLF